MNLDPAIATRKRGVLNVAFIIVFIFSFIDVSAQRISFSSSYNVPIGELSWSYQGALDLKLKYSSILTRKRKTPQLSSFYIGYSVLQPVADTLYYVVDRGGYDGAGLGTAVFQPFRMFQFGVGHQWMLAISRQFFLTPGLNLGGISGKREIAFEDTFGGSTSFSERVMWAALVPEFGMEYKFNDHFSTTAFVSYNFIIQTGDINEQSGDFTESAGFFYHYYSAGVSINFTF